MVTTIIIQVMGRRLNSSIGLAKAVRPRLILSDNEFQQMTKMRFPELGHEFSMNSVPKLSCKEKRKN